MTDPSRSLTRKGKDPMMIGFSDQWSTFWAMVRKELTVMARYPIEFISSFGRVFLIVAIFTLGAETFSSHQGGQIQEIGAGSSNTAGLVVYGFILFMFLSDTLWMIGYNIRNEQLQGTLEQLYLSPASKFASLVSPVCSRSPPAC
jgi:hypothetical protein